MKSSPGIVQLAERIEHDIRSRSLPVGHSYDTTADAARRFGVSTNRANRALQLLSNRGIIVRRQGAGAVVGDLPDPAAGPGLSRLNVIVSEVPVRTEGLLDDGILLGLQATLPGTALRQHFLPGEGVGAFIDDLIAEALKARGANAFVLFRSSAEVQRALAESGLPTVVSGGLQPSISGVAALDRDQFQIGVELAEYALRKRCSRFVCLLRDTTGPGDRRFARGITRTLAEAGVSLDRLTWEWPEADDGTVRAIVADHFHGTEKIAFLCRNEYLAEQTDAAIQASESIRPSPLIAMADCYRSDPEEARYPLPRPAWSPVEVGTKLGELLIEQAGKERSDHSVAETLIPVSAVA